jgi:hypothetical protein
MTLPNPNNPPLTFSFLSVGTDPIVTLPAQSGKVSGITQPLSHTASLVVQVGCRHFPATLTQWVVGNIFLLELVILAILLLTLGGCEPEPAIPFHG